MKLFNFFGGIHPEYHKDISTILPTAPTPIPEKLVYPLLQIDHKLSEPCVEIGQHILKNQIIAKPTSAKGSYIHAASSGLVENIIDHPIVHVSQSKSISIIIQTDGLDHAHTPYKQQMYDSGISGLGGANFPTVEKLKSTNIRTLIINGAECEPFITCDDILMREQANEIIASIGILKNMLPNTEFFFAIENNKPKAILEIQKAIQQTITNINLCIIPAIYPTGSEKQLIKVILNKVIPAKQYATQHGIICLNVGTVYAIYNALHNQQPLTERIITITGDAILQPRNYKIRIGTPINELLATIQKDLNTHEPLLNQGGPLMGIPIINSAAPVTKATNCITASTKLNRDTLSMPCIRCNRCTEVCPSKLLPQQLYWTIQGLQLENTKNYYLDDCIECGCCDYVCPSNIKLVDYFRYAKSQLNQQNNTKKMADAAKQRYEARNNRLEKQQKTKEQARADKLATLKPKRIGDVL